MAVVLPAAGQARRFGSGENKIWATLAGRPVLEWTLTAFQNHPGVDSITLVGGEADLERLREASAPFSKVRTVVLGGATRSESVKNGLYSLPLETELVLVHDAARPLVSAGVIDRVIEATRRVGACVPGLPLSDTVKRTDSNGIVHSTIPRVHKTEAETLSGLTAVQTPQGARVSLLRLAYERYDYTSSEPTDEASLIEALGEPVQIVPGDHRNLKITRPEDIALAESLGVTGGIIGATTEYTEYTEKNSEKKTENSVEENIEESIEENIPMTDEPTPKPHENPTPTNIANTHEHPTPNAQRLTPNAQRLTPNAQRLTPNAQRLTPNAQRLTPNAPFPEFRTGFGYDVHAFASPDAGRRLFLGGVEIPHDRGLEGHSDADVLLHAVCDALLGAVSLGDIGILFPNTDMTYKEISSLKLLEVVAQRLAEKGWQVVNIDATVVAEAPKLMPHRVAMQESMATCLGITPDRVSVKATTSEKLGFIGRREGMEASAIATVVKYSA